MLDIGTLIGGSAIGYLADYYNKRAIFLSPFLLVSAGIMWIISFFLSTPLEYYLSLLLLGICISGPYGLIGTVIAMDIGNHIK